MAAYRGFKAACQTATQARALRQERTHKGQHFPDRFAIRRHRQEQRQGFDDLLDRRDELVRDLRDGDSLILWDLEDLETCCDFEDKTLGRAGTPRRKRGEDRRAHVASLRSAAG